MCKAPILLIRIQQQIIFLHKLNNIKWIKIRGKKKFLSTVRMSKQLSLARCHCPFSSIVNNNKKVRIYSCSRDDVLSAVFASVHRKLCINQKSFWVERIIVRIRWQYPFKYWLLQCLNTPMFEQNTHTTCSNIEEFKHLSGAIAPSSNV